MQTNINMTAVEWLVEKFMTENTTKEGWHEIFEQAKEMEKERMLEFGTKVAMKAHSGQSGWSIIEVYNETFKQ